MIACCPILNILFENDIRDKWGNFEGVYTFQGFSNEMDYWVDSEGENAIWYFTSGSKYYWIFGHKTDLGSVSAVIFSSSYSLEKKCPHNEGYVWHWKYADTNTNSFVDTNDVYIKCANEDDICTTENQCIKDEGDCDVHDECQDGLFCGSNNCPDSLGFHSEFDCCYVPVVGDEYFCTTSNLCSENEGDCDSDAECQDGLLCGSNTCPTSLGFDSNIDCCYMSSVCSNMLTINSLKNSDSATVSGWNFDLDRGPWNYDATGLGSCGDGPWFGWKNGDEIGIISSTLHGTGTASITFGNCWETGEVRLLIDGNVISSAGPKSLISTEFQFDNSNLKLEEHFTGIIRFDDFEIPNCVCGNMQTINSLKNSDSATVAEWNFDLDKGPWNYDATGLGTCSDGSWFGWKNGDEIGIISSTLHGTGTASITFGNCWETGEVRLIIDGNVISSAGPKSLITSEFQFENSNIKLEEHNTGIIRFDDFEIPNCDARKKYSDKAERMSKLKPKYFHLENEMLPSNPQYHKKYMKRSRTKRNITKHKATIRKTKSQQITKLKSNCGGKKRTYQNTSIVCNHLASSVEGLKVVLNPNEQEYKTDAMKNNFIGFKYLVHSPYDFPYVEAVGKAMGPNIQSHIGFLGFHSWITDNADAYKPGQKNCASKHDIELDVFQDYTRKNCVFECMAKSLFRKCGCLPYQYPEFHLTNTGIWENVTSTVCNFTQLICLSNIKGTF